MVGAGRECADGTEKLLEELAVGRVRLLEGPKDRRRLTKKIGVHPIAHLIAMPHVTCETIDAVVEDCLE